LIVGLSWKKSTPLANATNKNQNQKTTVNNTKTDQPDQDKNREESPKHNHSLLHHFIVMK
jgi:hypothetical protein